MRVCSLPLLWCLTIEFLPMLIPLTIFVLYVFWRVECNYVRYDKWTDYAHYLRLSANNPMDWNHLNNLLHFSVTEMLPFALEQTKDRLRGICSVLIEQWYLFFAIVMLSSLYIGPGPIYCLQREGVQVFSKYT